MALRIDGAGALQTGEFNGLRQAAARTRDDAAREREGSGRSPEVAPGSPVRAGGGEGLRDVRLQRITESDTGDAARGPTRAYLAVQRNTITDSGGVELVGVDLYI